MSAPILTRELAAQFTKRLNQIQPDDKPSFGALTPTQLMRHLRFVFDMSLEKVEVPNISTFMTRNVVRILAFHWFTNWPGGKIKAPDFVIPEPEFSFEKEKQKVLETMNEFLDQADQKPDRKTLSPILGYITLEYWRRIHGIHMRHHFKQYNV